MHCRKSCTVYSQSPTFPYIRLFVVRDFKTCIPRVSLLESPSWKFSICFALGSAKAFLRVGRGTSGNQTHSTDGSPSEMQELHTFYHTVSASLCMLSTSCPIRDYTVIFYIYLFIKGTVRFQSYKMSHLGDRNAIAIRSIYVYASRHLVYASPTRSSAIT